MTEEEKVKLPEKIGVVANLLAGLRKAEGNGVWSIRAAVDTQVCNNEITWTLSKVMRGTTEEEVRKVVHDQVVVAFGKERVRDACITNRKSIAIFVRNLRGGKEDKKEELTAKLKANNGEVKWGKRVAIVASITPFVWGMKAEVESAEEAVKLIGQGVWWEGKKYEVELWRNATARALAGEGVNKVPEGPRGGGPLNGPREAE